MQMRVKKQSLSVCPPFKTLYCPKLYSCQWKHVYYEVQVCIA